MALTKQPDAAHIPAAGAVTVAEIVTPEVQVAAVQTILSKGPTKVDELLRDKQDEVRAILKTLSAAAGIDVSFVVTKIDDKSKVDVARAEFTDATSELSPEVLEACFKGLEKDFNRGIVVVDNKKTVDQYKADLSADKSAGTTWDAVQAKLEVNECALLEKAARMQGGGTLIGVYGNGKLCIKDRGNEPVIFGTTADGAKVTIATDTPNRDEVMQSVRNGGQFADYWEIRNAVAEDNYTLPLDAPNFEKEGIIAAVEAVTGEDFVRSGNGTEWRSAILECGNVLRSASVRVVAFGPGLGDAYVNNDAPERRDGGRGAVRVLSG